MRAVVLCALVIVVMAYHPAAESGDVGSEYPALVGRIIDGDTFDAQVAAYPNINIAERIRIRGIDTPELRAKLECERLMAVEAASELAALIGGRTVKIWQLARDGFGRMLANVSTAEGVDVGEHLIAIGLARQFARGNTTWCN